jgi:hypothetical protein
LACNGNVIVFRPSLHVYNHNIDVIFLPLLSSIA